MLLHMKPYSVDLRQRVLGALERGMSRAEIVRTFQISAGSLKRWLKQQRQTGSLQPRRPSGRHATLDTTTDAALLQQLEATPDATIAEHTQNWNATHHKPVSQSTMGRAIRRLNWTRKKRF